MWWPKLPSTVFILVTLVLIYAMRRWPTAPRPSIPQTLTASLLFTDSTVPPHQSSATWGLSCPPHALSPALHPCSSLPRLLPGAPHALSLSLAGASGATVLVELLTPAAPGLLVPLALCRRRLPHAWGSAATPIDCFPEFAEDAAAPVTALRVTAGPSGGSPLRGVATFTRLAPPRSLALLALRLAAGAAVAGGACLWCTWRQCARAREKVAAPL